jgi:hypothetical protein
MTKKQPFCWKCQSKITAPNDDGKSSSLVGCKEEPKIKNYSDAEKMCPLFKQKVLIIINSGVAQLEYKPDNVEIEIRDYDVDNFGEWDPNDLSCKKDSDGDRYQEIIFSSTE